MPETSATLWPLMDEIDGVRVAVGGDVAGGGGGLEGGDGGRSSLEREGGGFALTLIDHGSNIYIEREISKKAEGN